MRVELHCHSCYSYDSNTKIKDIVNSGLGAVAITDHDTMEGYRKAYKRNNGNVVLVPAVEVSFEGHLLCYGIDEIPVHKSPMDLVDKVHEQGGIIAAAHPQGVFRPTFDNIEILKKVDALETVNGLTLNKGNERAKTLAHKLGKSEVCGSDAHVSEDIGRYACEMDVHDVDGILKCIKNGRMRFVRYKTNFSHIVKVKLQKQIFKLHK